MKNLVKKSRSKTKPILSNQLESLLETRKSTIREENINNTKNEFFEIDIDRSGYIDIKELHKGLKKYGINVSIKNTKNLLKKYDDNPDGKIEMREFIQLKNDIDTKKFRKIKFRKIKFSNNTKYNKRKRNKRKHNNTKRKKKSKNTKSRK